MAESPAVPALDMEKERGAASILNIPSIQGADERLR